jgi:hypothetical protein
MKMTKTPDNGNLPSYLVQWITNDKKELLPRAIHHSSNAFSFPMLHLLTSKINAGKQ